MSKQGQTPRALFTLYVTEQRGEDNEVSHKLQFTAWGTLAENLVESGGKGMRLVVAARVNTYEKEVEGEDYPLTMVSFTATAAGPDLRWATAEVERNARPNSESKTKTSPSRDEADEEPPARTKAKAGAARSKAKAAAFDDEDEPF